METFGVSKEVFHSLFEVGLGAAHGEFPCQVAFNLVDSNCVCTEFIVSTATGVLGVTIACKGVKV